MLNSIPNFNYPDVLVPIDISPDPLINIEEVLSQFDKSITKSQVLHLSDKILKPDVLKLLNDRNLFVDKIDVWKWSLTNTSRLKPHTDGSVDGGRRVGLNWKLVDGDDYVAFFDKKMLVPKFEKEPDGRCHTFWISDKDQQPLVKWSSKIPSLMNTQCPHQVIGRNDAYRYSMTIKFMGNPYFDEVLNKLSDLRLDKDYTVDN